MEYIYFTETLLEEAKKNPNLEIIGEAEEFEFIDGNLL